jgi:hypothetical protein
MRPVKHSTGDAPHSAGRSRRQVDHGQPPDALRHMPPQHVRLRQEVAGSRASCYEHDCDLRRRRPGVQHRARYDKRWGRIDQTRGPSQPTLPSPPLLTVLGGSANPVKDAKNQRTTTDVHPIANSEGHDRQPAKGQEITSWCRIPDGKSVVLYFDQTKLENSARRRGLTITEATVTDAQGTRYTTPYQDLSATASSA